MRSSRRWAVTSIVLLSLVAVIGALHFSTSPATASAAAPTADLQQSLRQRQARLQAMSPEQNAAFMQRVAAWDALSTAQRQDQRARYQAWLALDASERAQLQAVATEFATFPIERQQALRQQFMALDDSQRHGWLLGPALGADYEKLHPLIAYVPADQRLPLLAALRAMDANQRADLAVLAQRTPPQERDDLRAELLAVPPGTFASWLKRKLDQ